MAVKHFNLPDPGEGLVEAEIVTWKVKVGDTLRINDIVVEIETAKSLVELPVPYAGTVTALLAAEGDTVAVGTPIIAVDDGLGGDPVSAPVAPGAPVAQSASGTAVSGAAPSGADVTGTATSEDEASETGGRVPNLVGYGPRVTETKRRPRKASGVAGQAAVPVARPLAPQPLAPQPPAAQPSAPGLTPAPGSNIVATQAVSMPGEARGNVLAKPPVRKLARDLGVDLLQIVGSGAEGIVTRADVEAHAAGGSGAGSDEASASDQARAADQARASDQATAGARSTPYVPPVFAVVGQRETRIPVKGVRKVTAQAMVASAFTAPHVTEFITVEVTRMMKLVDRLKVDPEFRNVKVSPLLVVARALIIASARNPGINASWDEPAQEIVVKSYVNLGIAAATPRGLMVPNIKDADQMTLLQLAEAMANLVSTAREGRTQPADMSGGSITITNVGVFGVDTGTPILNSGEAAILCFGAVRQMPWVVKGKIKPRWVTQLGLSFDHRLVNGDLGSRFLADVAAILHDPGKALVWG